MATSGSGDSGGSGSPATSASLNARLEEARLAAAADDGYSSDEFRQMLSEAIKGSTGKVPYSWQLDTGEALRLKLDCLLLAGTGAGKTMTFLMPIMADNTGKKMVIIVSPLNELQKDQVSETVYRILEVDAHRCFTGKAIQCYRHPCNARKWNNVESSARASKYAANSDIILTRTGYLGYYNGGVSHPPNIAGDAPGAFPVLVHC